MKIVTSRQLDEGLPKDLTPYSGGVMTLTSRDWGSVLEAYDQNLKPLWDQRFGTKGVAFVEGHGKTWLLDQEGARDIDADSAGATRVGVNRCRGMELCAAAPVEDGFVFASQHRTRRMRPPTLERVNLDGSVAWSVSLPVGSVAHDGVVQMRADEGWKARPMDPWMPQTWFTTSSRLTVSGDAVLACFTEMPRSGIGYGYVVSLVDGSLRNITKTGPITEVASAGGGAFYVGYQGYGAFETLHYDRGGRVLDQWASHGYYLTEGDLRAIEMENQLPSKMHLVRLLHGGQVEKGAWLDGYYTSRPFSSAEGVVYFFRHGAILSARELKILERLELAATEDSTYSTRMVGADGMLYVAYARVEHGDYANPIVNLVQVRL